MLKTLLTAIIIGIIIFSCSSGNQNHQEYQSHVGSKKNSQWAKDQPYVVMISFDGFRHDYAEEFSAKNILKFSNQGVTSSSLIPSFPSKTFPNHYSLVTGLYPSHHGIVSNEFYSREKDQWYKTRDKSVVTDGSWYSGTPLWSLAEKAGMLSASYFWIGSEAEINNERPTYVYPYDGSVPNSARFNQVIDWLKMEAEVRPHFITVYFSSVDDAGHTFGPDSPKTEAAVLHLDSLFGDFMDKMYQLKLPINVVLVSDHGMTEINHGIVLSDLIDLEGCRVSTSFPPMIYCPDSLKVLEIESRLKQDGRITAYRPSELPARLHYEVHERIGDLILYTEAPTVILKSPERVSGGTHGFDPFMNKDMGAFFAASGPAFKEGMVAETFENVHVYPMIAQILGLNFLDSIDGSIQVLKPLLK